MFPQRVYVTGFFASIVGNDFLKDIELFQGVMLYFLEKICYSFVFFI